MLRRLVLPRRLVCGSALPRRIGLPVAGRDSNLSARVFLPRLVVYRLTVHPGQLLPSGIVELVAVRSRILLHGPDV